MICSSAAGQHITPVMLPEIPLKCGQSLDIFPWWQINLVLNQFLPRLCWRSCIKIGAWYAGKWIYRLLSDISVICDSLGKLPRHWKKTIVCSVNYLSCVWCQATAGLNDGLLLIRLLWENSNGIWIKTRNICYKRSSYDTGYTVQGTMRH